VLDVVPDGSVHILSLSLAGWQDYRARDVASLSLAHRFPDLRGYASLRLTLRSGREVRVVGSSVPMYRRSTDTFVGGPIRPARLHLVGRSRMSALVEQRLGQPVTVESAFRT